MSFSIPNYALDVHTVAGRAKGRGIRHFMEVGAQLCPALPGRDITFRAHVMETLSDHG